MKSALNPYALTFLCAVMCSCSKNDTNDLNADITAFHTNATQKAGLNQGSHTLSLEENEALNGNTNSMTAEGISQFDNALNASFTVLSDNLTNINLTIISNVFAGLPDPTSIILSVDKYSKLLCR